jgi:hypothetical protein
MNYRYEFDVLTSVAELTQVDIANYFSMPRATLMYMVKNEVESVKIKDGQTIYLKDVMELVRCRAEDNYNRQFTRKFKMSF